MFMSKVHRIAKRVCILAATSSALLFCTLPARAQLLETYQAFLGPSDHFNSSGARLTQPWQIIRQDRANFHKFGVRDPGDEYDSFFALEANRSLMEQMILNGSIQRSAANRIVNGNVFIRVEIYPNSVNVTVN